MASDTLLLQRVAPPTKGLLLNGAPHAYQKGYASELTNFLPGRVEYVPVRGSALRRSEFGDDGIVLGAVPFGDKILVTRGLVGNLVLGIDGKRGRWDPGPGEFGVDDTLYFLTPTGTDQFIVDTLVTGNQFFCPRERYARLGARVYGYNIGSGGSLTIGGAVESLRSLYAWDGSVGLPTMYANAPKSCVDIKAFTNRLFVAGGTPPDVPDGPTVPVINGSFLTDTANWTAGSGSIARDTTTFDTSPASGHWTGFATNGTLTGAFTGTFIAGTTYTLTVRVAGGVFQSPLEATFGESTDVATQFLTTSGSATFGTYTINWTPTSNRSSAKIVFKAHQTINQSYWIDTLTVSGTSTYGSPEVSTLFYTDPMPTGGAAFSDAVTTWEDDVTGLINRIVVESDDQDDMISGLATIPGGLVIFKTRSTHVLYGSGTSNYLVKQISASYGCISTDSIVEIQGGVAFASAQGYMFFDGSRFEELSASISQVLTAQMRANARWPDSVAGGTQCAKLPNDYIMLNTQKIAQTGAILDSDSYLLHFPTRTWTRYRPANFTAAGSDGAPFTFIGGGNRHPLGFDTRGAWDLSRVTVPEDAGVGDGDGGDFAMGADYDVVNSTRTAFDATMTLPTLDLASTQGVSAQLNRIITEYRVSGADFTTSDDTFAVTLNSTGDAGTDIATWAVKAMDPALRTDLARRQRDSHDVRNEAGDLSITVTWSGIDTANVQWAYFYGLTAVFQAARQLPSGW